MPPNYGFRPVKTRALRSLLGGPPQRVVAIVAPMGFGKTVLLTQLHARLCEDARCLWLGLDDQHIGLRRLLGLFEELLGLADIGAEGPMMADPRGEDEARIDRILRAFGDLTAGGANVALFLDNMNACDDPDLRLLLDALVFRAPRRLRIFMTSTGPIPFDTPRAMLEMKLRRLGSMELSFDRDDAFALLTDAGIADLSEATVSGMVTRSEGWPAALRLMQLVLRGQDGGATRAEDFTGGDINLAELLSRKLMHTFPSELIDFLLDISVLRGFCAELAVAATGIAESRRWIEYLVERNVLMVPLTPDREWWRFHSLFREFLVTESARRQDIGRRHAVAARAAAWLEQRGEIEQALNMAIEARDDTRAAHLLELVSRPMVRDRGDLSSYLALMDRVRVAGIRPGSDALFWQAWAMAFSRDYAGARLALQALRQSVAKDGTEAGVPVDLARRLSLIEIIVDFHLDDLAAVRRKAPLWLEGSAGLDMPDGRRYFGHASVAAGYAFALTSQSDFPRANQAAHAVQHAITRTDSNYGKVWSALVGATIEVAQGNPLAARHWIDSVSGDARRALGAEASIVAVLRLVEGRIAADLGDLKIASRGIQASLPRAIENSVLDIVWQAMEVAVELAGSENEIVPIEVLRAHALRFGERLARLLDLAELRRHLRQGNIDTAQEYAWRLGMGPTLAAPEWLGDGAEPMVRSFAEVVSAELLLVLGHPKKAENLISRALVSAETEGRRSAVVELRLLQVAMAHRLGDAQAGASALGRAIVVAARIGLMRPFLAQTRLLSEIIPGFRLKQLGLIRETEIGFFHKLCKTLEIRVSEATEAPLISAMTPRELEILRQLATGLSNGQIAERLDLTLPTVKWHLANIYSKLGVSNRAATLVRARSLGISE